MLTGFKNRLVENCSFAGAKLCHLKQNLQATMRVKREQERLKRREAYKLDNEEGFGGEEDEDEAELTDGSETEGEEERGMIGHEDEDADYEVRMCSRFYSKY